MKLHTTLIIFIALSCTGNSEPPVGTPAVSEQLDGARVTVWNDHALVQSHAGRWGRISVRTLPGLIEVGAWTDVGHVRWVGTAAGEHQGVILGAYAHGAGAQTPWFGWAEELPSSEVRVDDDVTWSFLGPRGDGYVDATVFDADDDGEDDAVLWGPDENGGTAATWLPMASTGSHDIFDLEKHHSWQTRSMLTFDGDGDGLDEAYFSAPMALVPIPFDSLDSPEVIAYDANARKIGDLTGDGMDDVLLSVTDELVVLPAGEVGTPIDDLLGRVRIDGCSLYHEGVGLAWADVTGDGATDLLLSLRGCGDQDVIRVVPGPILQNLDLAAFPPVRITQGEWGPHSFYDVNGDGRQDLLLGVYETVDSPAHVEVEDGTELAP